MGTLGQGARREGRELAKEPSALWTDSRLAVFGFETEVLMDGQVQT